MNRLYPEGMSKQEIETLSKAYKIQENLKQVNEYQSEIHPLLHDKGRANDHTDSWRKIEHTQKLIKSLIHELKNY